MGTGGQESEQVGQLQLAPPTSGGLAAVANGQMSSVLMAPIPGNPENSPLFVSYLHLACF